MKRQGVDGCVGAAGSKLGAPGVKARQIQRLAASILRRLEREPDLMQYMIRTYINNASFSTIRPDLIRELVIQAQGVDLKCKLKLELIAPLRVQTELEQKFTFLVGA